MPITRSTFAGALLSASIGAALVAAGCGDVEPESAEITRAPVTTPAIPPLVPPEPYVLAPDGTRQDLVQAGIYRPDGKKWARILGKALFWDEQSGSDGNACASCHFHAGADTRLKNQLNPGSHDLTKSKDGDTAFGSLRSDTGDVLPGRMASGAMASPNYELKPTDMPLHRLENELDRNSRIITTTNDRVSSLGSFEATFRRVRVLGGKDRCIDPKSTTYRAGPYAARQVEPRNTPSFHNAAFNFRNFWDNRANNLFNGVGVFGMRDVLGDKSKRLIIRDASGRPTLGYLSVEDASLASQAVAPPLSELEMSCEGRTFADVGRKLLFTIPLRDQRVSKQDSVLGPYVSPFGHGLHPRYSYAALIQKAFDPKYWSLAGRWRITGNGELVADPFGYSQMEINFSMFWGLAIAEYEATQISDRSEIDILQEQENPDDRLVMTPAFAPIAGCRFASGRAPRNQDEALLLRGCTIFSRPSFLPPTQDGARGGSCFICHNGGGAPVGPNRRQPLLSEASFKNGESFPLFLTVPDVNGVIDLRDNGSANIGLRPVFSDKMSGETDPYGNPLSFGRQYWRYLKNGSDPNQILDPPLLRAIATGAAPDPAAFAKLEADGSTKAPILRNVALTPPYFSWGGYPNLRQMLKVYNRGMNRRDITASGSLDANGSACSTGDDTGSGPDGDQAWPVQGQDCNTNTTGLIAPLGLRDCDQPGSGCDPATDDLAALERFLKSLTDRRVQCDQAPFDHPELTIFVGHTETDRNRDGRADDVTFKLPAVGAAGYDPSSGFCIPNAGDLFAYGMQARSGGPKKILLGE